MRRKMIIANWKMNLSSKGSQNVARTIVSSIVKLSKEYERTLPTIVLCPSFSALSGVASITKKSNRKIKLGSQNCFWETSGSFTGEESPQYLAELGVEYAIIGHSERRMLLKESDDMIQRKVRILCQQSAIIPIICVGENKNERSANVYRKVIKQQVRAAIFPLRKPINSRRPLIIAYEPIWAIGTGIACSVKECARIYALIRGILARELGSAYDAEWSAVLYGGSVSKKNIMEFVQPNVSDGVLVGGASLDAKTFNEMVRCLAKESV